LIADSGHGVFLCSRHGEAEEEKCIYNFSGKAREKRLLGRPGGTWEDNTKMDLRKVGREVKD
jgi:hypothetical protein